MQLSNILFLDIETAPQYPTFKESDKAFQSLWEDKARFLLREEGDSAESLFDRAGIYAEFGKIICISVGLVDDRTRERELRIKSFADDDEHALLTSFAGLLDQHFGGDEHLLCAHNGKEFDFPYVARRMLINGIMIPKILDVSGKKPWEVRHLDTMQMWKFGDYKHYTSLKLLAHVFDLPTPKDDIDGSQVAAVYWKEKDLPRIVRYCEKDVITLIRVYLHLVQLPPLKESEISARGTE